MKPEDVALLERIDRAADFAAKQRLLVYATGRAPWSLATPSYLRTLAPDAYWFHLAATVDFHLLLDDAAVVQFTRSDDPRSLLSYRYVAAPVLTRGYRDFVASLGGDPDDGEYWEMFRESLDTAPARPPGYLVSIRYDHSPELYNPLSHPSSHIHFGPGDSCVRVACERVLTPEAFMMFVARQCYPHAWDAWRKSGADAQEHGTHVRERCERAIVDDESAQWELRLT